MDTLKRNSDTLRTEPIRILHVVTYMGRGGLETMIMNYYRHMDRNRVQFDFLTHREDRADYDDEIKALGGRIYRLPRLVPWSGSYHRALDDFLDAHPEYRIIHVHQDCLSSVILKAARKHQIPGSATELFACGAEAGDWMFGGAPYRIVNNAIDTKRYSFNEAARQKARQALGIPRDAFIVGHVGRFNRVKNHTFLLDVFAKLWQMQENTYLLLVGDGDLRGEMEEKAAALGIGNSVIFTGVRSDVPDLMQAMDCFVFPSLYEGLPVSLRPRQKRDNICCAADETQYGISRLLPHRKRAFPPQGGNARFSYPLNLPVYIPRPSRFLSLQAPGKLTLLSASHSREPPEAAFRSSVFSGFALTHPSLISSACCCSAPARCFSAICALYIQEICRLVFAVDASSGKLHSM